MSDVKTGLVMATKKRPKAIHYGSVVLRWTHCGLPHGTQLETSDPEKVTCLRCRKELLLDGV